MGLEAKKLQQTFVYYLNIPGNVLGIGVLWVIP